MTKAVAYLRVSGASQVDSHGFDRQIETITNYAAGNDFQITGIYREEAVAGRTEMDARPAFMTMLADLLSNGCRTIIVERLHRLAREFRVQEELLLYLMRKQLTWRRDDSRRSAGVVFNQPPRRNAVAARSRPRDRAWAPAVPAPPADKRPVCGG